jgi:hypothetical protein
MRPSFTPTQCGDSIESRRTRRPRAPRRRAVTRTRRLHEGAIHPQVPVHCLSGLDSTHDRRRCRLYPRPTLPGTARIPNGGPRRRVTGGGPHHGPDPVQVLASIMGGLPRKPLAGDDTSRVIPQKPEELVGDIDFGGLSLQDFAAQAPAAQRQSTLVHTYSAQSVEECTSSNPAFSLPAHCDCRRQGKGQV